MRSTLLYPLRATPTPHDAYKWDVTDCTGAWVATCVSRVAANDLIRAYNALDVAVDTLAGCLRLARAEPHAYHRIAVAIARLQGAPVRAATDDQEDRP